jgi:hypothetical protein
MSDNRSCLPRELHGIQVSLWWSYAARRGGPTTARAA